MEGDLIFRIVQRALDERTEENEKKRSEGGKKKEAQGTEEVYTDGQL